MARPIGVSFLPGSETPSRHPSGDATGGSDLAQAIKILSLRLPRVVGARAIASPRLLTSPGAAGIPGANPHAAVFEALLKSIAGGGGMSSPGMPGPSTPSEPWTPGPDRGAPWTPGPTPPTIPPPFPLPAPHITPGIVPPGGSFAPGPDRANTPLPPPIEIPRQPEPPPGIWNPSPPEPDPVMAGPDPGSAPLPDALWEMLAARRRGRQV